MHTEREIIQAWVDHGSPTDDDGVPQFDDAWLRPSDLKSKAARWLDVSQEYWEASHREGIGGAVVWADSESGALAIYTRFEYANQLRAAIPGDMASRIVF